MSESAEHVLDELRAILAEEGSELSNDQVLALRQFVEQVGSLEEASQALDLLDELDEAA